MTRLGQLHDSLGDVGTITRACHLVRGAGQATAFSEGPHELISEVLALPLGTKHPAGAYRELEVAEFRC